MRRSVDELRAFYGEPVGALVRRSVARRLEDAGAYSIVLELMPSDPEVVDLKADVEEITAQIVADVLGRPTPRTTMLVPGLPEEIVFPIEIGLIGLGLLGSLLALFQIASRERPTQARGTFLPWAVLSLALAGAAVWLLSQPMEMRGTFLGV